jgi:hypothetical protein
VCSRWQPQGASHETSRTDTAGSRAQGRDHSGQQHGDRLPPLGRARSVGNLILRSTAVSETAVHDSLTSCGSAYQCTSAGISLSVTAFCVRTVSHAPRNPGRTAWFTGQLRCTSLLREVVDRECVGACRSALVSATGINFQACSFNHSDISPSLESTVYGRSTPLSPGIVSDLSIWRNHLRLIPQAGGQPKDSLIR